MNTPRVIPARQRGFTLIEVIAAFTILALSFSVIMEILSHSTSNTVKSGEKTRIALLAQSKMDEVGLQIPIEEGSHSGRFDDRTEWSINIQPQDIPYEGDYNIDLAPIELFRVDLTIHWQTGRNRDASATFSTLKAMTPDLSNR